MTQFRNYVRRHHNLLLETTAPVTGPINKGKGKSNTAGKGHGKNQSGGGGVSAPADITLAVQEFDTATSISSADYTTTALGGLTPKAVLFLSSLGVGAAETAHAGLGMGATDGTSEATATWRSQDNQASTRDSSIYSSSKGFSIHHPSTVATAKDADATLIPNGVTLSYTTADATAYRAAFAAFAGANVSAKAGSVDLGLSTATVPVNCDFQPDAVIFFGNNHTGGGAIGYCRYVVGFLTATAQRCVAGDEANNRTLGTPWQTLFTDACAARIDSLASGALLWKMVGSITAAGFDLVPSASSGGTDISYLALKFTGGRVKLLDLTTPTSTGSQAITGVGFAPRMAIAVLTNLEATDSFPGSSTDNQGGLSVNFISNEQWGASMRLDAGADPTGTASQVANAAIIGASATDNDAILASLVSFDSDGMTLNWSSVQGTGKKGFILFIE